MLHTYTVAVETRQQHEESWLAADSPQDYVDYLARRMVLAAALVIALAIALHFFIADYIEQSERDEDLAFTAAVALVPGDSVGSLVNASGREALIWRPGEQPQTFLASTPSSAPFDRWRVGVRNRAIVGGPERFLRLEPDSARANTAAEAGDLGTSWRIVRAPVSGQTIDSNDLLEPLDETFDDLDGAVVLLANVRTGRFLDADVDGSVTASSSAAEGDQWLLMQRSSTFELRHIESGLLLHAEGQSRAFGLSLSAESAQDTTWSLSPRGDRTYAFANESRRSIEDRQFDSVDPAGDTWWHTSMRTLDGSTLVASRRASDGLSLVGTIDGLLAASAAILILALGWLWMVLYKRTARPLRQLLTAGEDLRVRGELREDVRQAIDKIRDRPIEIRELGRILQGIEAETIRGHAQAESLLAAASALGASLDQATVLDGSLDQLNRLLGVERSAILSYDPRVERVDVIASRGHTAQYLADIVEAEPDDTLPSRRALRDRVPVQVPDTTSEVVAPALRQRAHSHGYRSLLAVPLTSELERPTVLVLHANQARAFSHDEIELSKSFASIAGAAIRNAELFARTDDDLRQQTLRLEAIVESVDQGILVERVDGSLIFANARMRALAGLSDQIRIERSAELISAIAENTVDARKTRESLEAADSLLHTSVDVEIVTGTTAQHYSVRSFDVVDSRGKSIGRGQVWTDVTRDRELDRMKHGLLATVSHEFRTPLALIKGYATTLLADDVEWDPRDRHEFITLVSAEADRLTNLVQRLLDMRRIDAGMVSLQRIPIELAVIVQSTLDGMPHQRDRIIVNELPERSISVDAARIVTVLRNLLENACTYSPDGSPVELTITAGEHQVEVRVRDYGPGVDFAVRDRIFETFVRGDSALTAEFSGIGLGLAIARGFVEAHDGRIWVGDADDGPGAVFGFTLPTDAGPTILPAVAPSNRADQQR